MASVTLRPTRATPITAIGNGWENEGYILQDDSNFATCASGTPIQLIGFAFTAGLPQDIQLVGFEVIVKSRTNAASGNTVDVAFSFDKGVTISTNYVASTAQASSFATYTIGSPTELLGYTKWKRPKIHGNNDFTVVLRKSGTTATQLYVQYVEVKVYYNLRTKIGGERSVFPVDPASWPYDGASDDIPILYNGTGPSHQVQSEQVNKLADCLYEIETFLLTDNNFIRVNSPTNSTALRVTTITVTGNISGSPTMITFQGTVQRKVSDSSYQVKTKTTNLTATVAQTEIPFPPNSYNIGSAQSTNIGFFCSHVKGIGWVDVTGTLTPLTISPRGILCRRINYSQGEHVTFSFGFQAFVNTSLTKSIVSTTDALGVDHYGCNTTFPTIPTGTVTIKLTGFSYEV